MISNKFIVTAFAAAAAFSSEATAQVVDSNGLNAFGTTILSPGALKKDIAECLDQGMVYELELNFKSLDVDAANQGQRTVHFDMATCTEDADEVGDGCPSYTIAGSAVILNLEGDVENEGDVEYTIRCCSSSNKCLIGVVDFVPGPPDEPIPYDSLCAVGNLNADNFDEVGGPWEEACSFGEDGKFEPCGPEPYTADCSDLDATCQNITEFKDSDNNQLTCPLPTFFTCEWNTLPNGTSPGLCEPLLPCTTLQWPVYTPDKNLCPFPSEMDCVDNCGPTL